MMHEIQDRMLLAEQRVRNLFGQEMGWQNPGGAADRDVFHAIASELKHVGMVDIATKEFTLFTKGGTYRGMKYIGNGKGSLQVYWTIADAVHDRLGFGAKATGAKIRETVRTAVEDVREGRYKRQFPISEW